jgi:hypothetical protein
MLELLVYVTVNCAPPGAVSVVVLNVSGGVAGELMLNWNVALEACGFLVGDEARALIEMEAVREDPTPSGQATLTASANIRTRTHTEGDSQIMVHRHRVGPSGTFAQR